MVLFILGTLFGIFISYIYTIIKYYRDPDEPIGDMEYYSTDDTIEGKIMNRNKKIKKFLNEWRNKC